MNSCSFYAEKFVYTKKDEDIDLSFIPSNTRRRLSLIDKHVLYMVNKFLDSGTENIIFSSRYGEFKRLINLISQQEELNESSPMMFSASVHNYSLGQISFLNQITIPTLAVSAGEMSFINGLITAITSSQKEIIYCYADDYDNDIIGICLKIKKNKGNKYIIKSIDKNADCNLNEIIELFENKRSRIELNKFSIERG